MNLFRKMALAAAVIVAIGFGSSVKADLILAGAVDLSGTGLGTVPTVLALKPDYANRTSYVIAPNGTIVYQYTSLNPYRHVSNTLAALKTWSAKP